VTVTADNQRSLAETLVAVDALERLADAEDLQDEQIVEAVARLLADEDRRRGLAANGAGLCDGRGAQRVADAIEALEAA
jgi:spore coat polysaccharide biosynthesis predicted glycosyltransferase SpsG